MKSRLIQTTTLALLLISAPFAAGADETKPKQGKADPFAAADTNQDGKLALAEFVGMNKKNPNPDAAKKRFARLDTNQDGFLSRKELQAGSKQGEQPREKPAADKKKAKKSE